jgi:hypothetical protein
LAIQRTFVASIGIDSNPCTLQLPCRGFAAAILLTDPNGEIIVLDSAGYGVVTVNKPISIISPQGVYAGVSVFAGQDGVTVSAGATDKIVLRGLAINGQGGNRGIVVTAAGQVHIEGCVVSNMGSDGIRIDGGTAAYVANSNVRSNNGNGIHLAAGSAEVFVDETRVANNILRGIYAEAGTLTLNRSQVENNGSSGLDVNPAGQVPVRAVVRDSLLAGNALTGVFALTNTAGEIVHVTVTGSSALRNGSSGFVANSNSVGTVTFVLSNSVTNENEGNGIFASGTGTTVSVSGSTISQNGGPGLVQSTSAVVRSHNNNAVNGNGGGIDISGTVIGVGLN